MSDNVEQIYGWLGNVFSGIFNIGAEVLSNIQVDQEQLDALAEGRPYITPEERHRLEIVAIEQRMREQFIANQQKLIQDGINAEHQRINDENQKLISQIQSNAQNHNNENAQNHNEDNNIRNYGDITISIPKNIQSGDSIEIEGTSYVAGLDFEIGENFHKTVLNVASIFETRGYCITVNLNNDEIYLGSADSNVGFRVGVLKFERNLAINDTIKIGEYELIAGKDFQIGNTLDETLANLKNKINEVCGSGTVRDSAGGLLTFDLEKNILNGDISLVTSGSVFHQFGSENTQNHNNQLIEFLSRPNSLDHSGSDPEQGILINSLEALKEQMPGAAEHLGELQSSIFSNSDIELTEEEEALATQFADAAFAEFKLTPEQLNQISHLTGRERVGLAGIMYGNITTALQLHTQATGVTHVNISGMFSKLIANPTTLLTAGNVIYRAIQNFKDGASTQDIFTVVIDGTRVVISGMKIIDSFIDTFKTMAEAEESGLKNFLSHYFEISETKMSTRDTFNYNLDVDSKTITIADDGITGTYRTLTDTPDLTFRGGDIEVDVTFGGTHQVPDVVPTGQLDELGRPLRGVGNVDAPDIPKVLTPDVPDVPKSHAGHILGGIGIASDLLWIGNSINTLVSAGSDLKPSHIMDLVGAVVTTVGDGVSLVGGPVGEIVGMVISAIGSTVSALGALTDLNSDSSTEDVALAVGDFVSSLNPLLPSPRAITQALRYQHLRESADNEIDMIIYTALHKISSLDATPLLNMFHGAYDDSLRGSARSELLNKFGTFDNMMRSYITSDKDFRNRLDEAADFLKRNANTDHTQFITAYLTGSQIKEIFGNESDYREGYDVRNVNTDLQVRGEYENEAFNLQNIHGLTILPVGKNLVNRDGRYVLDTISLGYGQGKQTITNEAGVEIQNPRVIDTATRVSYSKEQLQMFSNEFTREHTHYDTRLVVKEFMGTGLITAESEIVTDPDFEKPKVWLDLVDNMSGMVVRDSNSEVKTLPGINNRVITTISDMVFPRIETGFGDDDVIINNTERIYTGADSIVKAYADGGLGTDILDLSAMKEDGVNTFDFEYAVNENKLSFIRQNEDGKKYDLQFLNFEEIRLTGETNNIHVKENSDIEINEHTNIEEIRMISTSAKNNNIDLSGVRSKSLYLQCALDGINTIHGTENNDVVVVPKFKDAVGNGSSEIFGMGGNDLIIGGALTNAGERKNVLHGGDGQDYLKAAGESNVLYGDAGRDLLQGSNEQGTHILNGGVDSDTLVSGIVGAQLNGEEGNDVLIGGKGTDKLNGGIGNDYITGGEGIDEFIFSKDFGLDTIQDYNASDKLIFNADSGITSINQFTFVKNQDQGYLAMIYGDNCIKLNKWNDDNTLNVSIGGNTVDAGVIKNLIQSSSSFDSYITSTRESQVSPAAPSDYSYSTENPYTTVLSAAINAQY